MDKQSKNKKTIPPQLRLEKDKSTQFTVIELICLIGLFLVAFKVFQDIIIKVF